MKRLFLFNILLLSISVFSADVKIVVPTVES